MIGARLKKRFEATRLGANATVAMRYYQTMRNSGGSRAFALQKTWRISRLLLLDESRSAVQWSKRHLNRFMLTFTKLR